MKTKLSAWFGLILGAALMLGQYAAPALAAKGPPASRHGQRTGSSGPDGSEGRNNGRLAFGMTVNGNVDIYTVLPNGSDLRQLTSDPGFDACASWSADGKQMAYCSNANSPAGRYEIWTMEANGHDQRQVTHLGGAATFPSFSPDGRAIAFCARLPGSTDTEIYVINADGSGLVQLTAVPGDNLYPGWSPDGRTIAFISSRTGIPQVWLM